jgi:hypothetical protein
MIRSIVTAAALAGASGVASAGTTDLVASFGFTDLTGSYVGDSQGGTFTASAVGAGPLGTAGDVTRLLGGAGTTAEFDANFADDADESDVLITISVENINSQLVGSGSFEITDTDGDVFAGELSGTWDIGGFGFVFFNAEITTASFSDDGDSTDTGTFDGPSGGSFVYSDLQALVLNGAFSILFREADAFDQNFEGASVQADGIVVPTPGSVLVAGVGLASMVRRRR